MSEAEALAREAVDLMAQSDTPEWRAHTLMELASVLEARGRAEEAREVLGEAILVYQSKGDIVSAEQATTRARSLE